MIAMIFLPALGYFVWMASRHGIRFAFRMFVLAVVVNVALFWMVTR
jgi:hypothetical protein